MMNSRALRFGVVIVLSAFVFVFFVPILPFTQVVTPTCSAPGPGGISFCSAMPWGGSYSGYQAIGFLLTGWGATYSGWLGGYVPPPISFDFGSGYSTLTAEGVVFSVLLPIAVVSIWLLSPELVKSSRVTRAGLGVFGLFLFALADLMMVSMVQQARFPWFYDLLGTFFGASGVLMVLYAMHVWPLGLWEREDTVGEAPRKYPAPAPANIATTSREAMTSFLMPHRVAPWGVKFYSRERPSDFGGVGQCH